MNSADPERISTPKDATGAKEEQEGLKKKLPLISQISADRKREEIPSLKNRRSSAQISGMFF